MQISKMDKEAYKKLIMYAYEICDKFELRKVKFMGGSKKESQKKLKIITSNSKFTKKNIIENYSKKMVEDIYIEYKDDDRFRCSDKRKNMLKKYYGGEEYQNAIIKSEKNMIDTTLFLFLYNEKCKEFLKKYKNILINKINEEYATYYYFKIDKQFIDLLLNKTDNIYSFIHPYNLEFLCLYIGNDIWLESISDDKVCFIYCRNEEEYKKLKSFGIEFVEDKFVQN